MIVTKKECSKRLPMENIARLPMENLMGMKLRKRRKRKNMKMRKMGLQFPLLPPLLLLHCKR
jgi:hypothetical protein